MKPRGITITIIFSALVAGECLIFTPALENYPIWRLGVLSSRTTNSRFMAVASIANISQAASEAQPNQPGELSEQITWQSINQAEVRGF